MNHAARTAALLEVAAQAAAAGHGGKERIYDLACQQYGWSKPSLKRWLSALAAATGAKPRKRRSDAGTIALTLEHAQLISGALMQGWRAQDKKYTSMRVTLERLRKNVPTLPPRSITIRGRSFLCLKVPSRAGCAITNCTLTNCASPRLRKSCAATTLTKCGRLMPPSACCSMFPRVMPCST